ncbi:uncharacterized protein EDB91DRAFT_1031608, partial [Suillus paluster]|uniref:uncharacterized protein n=1 Tax=Suillus paluster TaxID=48578 RepID=UPI001B86505D
WYMQRMRKLAMSISAMYKAAFPKDFEIYCKAFAAGIWLEADPSPWLGRAIVWKLNVLPHCNGLDAGPAAIFCMGQYSGGECYLTDLQIKLRYHPGDVLIFRAGDLYHSIGNWESEGGVTKGGIMPGHVGNVFFSPAHSVNFLKNQGRRWMKRTAGGALPE